jgi:hypothetical protein
MTVLALDLGHATVTDAEHWLADVPPVPGLVACTHLVPGEHARVVITLAAPGRVDPATLPPPAQRHAAPADGAALAAAQAHAAGTGGRAVLFPGADRLVGELTVAQVLAHSAIDRVRVLGGVAQPDADTLVLTRDFVRPQWLDGVLTLVATQAPNGRIAPFEVPNPTPCCAAH